MVDVPAGWYPDPHGSKRWRWWDGERWTEQYAPVQPAAKSDTDPRNDALVTLGYILAILLPFVALFIAIALMARGDRRGGGVLVVSAIVFIVGVLVLTGSAS